VTQSVIDLEEQVREALKDIAEAPRLRLGPVDQIQFRLDLAMAVLALDDALLALLTRHPASDLSSTRNEALAVLRPADRPKESITVQNRVHNSPERPEEPEEQPEDCDHAYEFTERSEIGTCIYCGRPNPFVHRPPAEPELGELERLVMVEDLATALRALARRLDALEAKVGHAAE
jgi:hypothetical protein